MKLDLYDRLTLIVEQSEQKIFNDLIEKKEKIYLTLLMNDFPTDQKSIGCTGDEIVTKSI